MSERMEAIPYKDYASGYSYKLYKRHIPDDRAAFAMELMSRHAGITAQQDGEDTAGRAKMRREQPAELARFCCEVAEAAFAEFEERGWLLHLPSYEELKSAARPEN